MDKSVKNGSLSEDESEMAFSALEKSILAALTHYSNVHRGSGHFSKVSTRLYEKSREVVLDYLGLKKSRFQVLFLSPRRAEAFTDCLEPGSFRTLSVNETGLPLGVVAVIVKKSVMPKGTPFETGGGTTKLYGSDWVLWAGQPDRFEAGTPAIINVIAFARALQLMQRYGKGIFTGNAEPFEANDRDGFEGIQEEALLKALRETMVGHGVQVPTTKGLRPFINLDNSASTPAFLPAWEAFRRTIRLSKQVAAKVADETRQVCAGFLEAPASEFDVFFTSGTTESINLAAIGFGNQPSAETDPVILTTVLEHSSNDLPWRSVPGHSVIRLEAGNDGILDLKKLESLLSDYNEKLLHGKKRIKLVTVSGASNVLGTCNDLRAISAMVHQRGALLMVDAAQLAAHRQIFMQSDGFDLLALSAHKMYAPFGTGVLVARKGLLKFDERALNAVKASGEANPGGIAALGMAMQLLQRIGFGLIEKEEHKLTDKALSELSQLEGIKLYGPMPSGPQGVTAKTGVIGFSVKSGMPATVARKLALTGGMGVRFGCLCSHLIIKQLSGFTPFQEKFQRFVVKLVPVLNLQGIVRASFGIQTTESDVIALVNEMKLVVRQPKGEMSNTQLQPTSDSKSIYDTRTVKRQVKAFIEAVESQVFG